MAKKYSIKAIAFVFMAVASIFGGTVSAQRGTFQKNQGIQRNHYRPNNSSGPRKPNAHGGTLVVPGPPIVVEEVVVPVEVVVVEHTDTIYRTFIYNPNPIKGHFTTLAGLQFTKGDNFNPGFNAGCRGDWYKEKNNFAGYAALGCKFELSHFWMEEAPAYSHNSFFYFDLYFHYGMRFKKSNGDVVAFGLGPVLGISPYGRTVNQERSYSTFSGRDISNRVQSGVDCEILYTHKHLFFSAELMKMYTPYEFEIDAKGMGLGFALNAGYRF